jgi:hypothetical protein
MKGTMKVSAPFYVSLLFLLVFISAGVSYMKYVINSDFTYFETEEEIPSQFDLATYLDI